MIDNFEEWHQELERIVVLTNCSITNLDKESFREYHETGHTPAQAWQEELLLAQESWIAGVDSGESDDNN